MAELPPTVPLKVLYLGHSFVRRISDYIDLHPTHLNFGLSSSTHDIHFIGRPGGHARHLARAFPAVLELAPDLVFLDIGTNDLTVMHPQELFSQVMATARGLVNTCGVKTVVLLQVLPRTVEGRFGQPAEFQTKVEQYNNIIQSNVYHQKFIDPVYNVPSTPITYWFHRGFRSDIGSLIVDGVHLNQTGLPLYIKSLKRAILRFSPEVRRQLALSS